MQALRQSKKLSRPLLIASTTSFRTRTTFYAALASRSFSNLVASLASNAAITINSRNILGMSPTPNLLSSPWSAVQLRGIKVSGSDVRVGNVIEKQGRIYEVLKVDHSHEGRGKATMKVELRDVNHGNKVTQRLATDEGVERVFVEEKTFLYMCTDRDGTVVLLDPSSLDQLEVSKDLFGKKAIYLQEEMKVKVQVYDEVPLSASVPKRVTCTVKEAQPNIKGIGATPRNKKVVLDNGLTIEVPPHVVVGDAVVVNTDEDYYIERAKA
ncbi:Elongation factor P [Quillaja saponaria]|uniref:Elongation factor P n=1 Tax=Quillaja saponaria TaxID=32244 RepID=A0AAD7LDS0_QUISA|nr:Elongation factor P [Quillaja saponaria]